MNAKKTVIVTGSGRGIGAATAILFAAHGYQVCINYKSDADSAAQVQQTILDNGGSAITGQADVSDENGVNYLFSQVDKKYGRPDVLINNVGIINPQSPLVDMTLSRIEETFRNNVLSYFLCCREAIKRMSLKHGGNGGTIVNISSGASRTGSPFEYIDYAASKGAVDTLTRGLATELAAEGIRVNGVRPGMIYTDIHADGGDPDRVKRKEVLVPLRRGGRPEEIAEAILWLAGGKSSYTTGSIIDATGGL